MNRRPDHKCSHEENRRKVCAPCGKKIAFGKTSITKFLVNEKTEKLIKEFVSVTYDIRDDKFPIGLCRTCYLTLLDAHKGIFERPMPKMPAEYRNIVLPKYTRENETCNCYICLTGRYQGHSKVIKGRNHKRTFEVVIDTPKGRYGGSNITSLPKKIKEPRKRFSDNICCSCRQNIGRGISHKCKNVVQNVESIVLQLPEKQRDQVVSSVLKNKKELIDCNSQHIEDVSLTLATRGRPCTVILNPKKASNIEISAEQFDNFRGNMGMSLNAMKKFTNFIRANVGKKAVPVGITKHMSEQSKILKDIYKLDSAEFDIDAGGIKKKRPIVYANASELLDAIIDKREMIGYVSVKLMADGGQDFFKMSLTVLPEDYTEEIIEYENSSDSDSESKSKRSKYSEGGTVGRKAKLTSVNRLILLCIVPNIKETYENLDILFELTKVNDIPCKFLADFKLLLTVNGMQTASASYPCPYCFITLQDLRAFQDEPSDNSSKPSTSNTPHDIEPGKEERLKTYGDLRADYEKYCVGGKKKKYAPACRSTVNLPLFREENEMTVLQKCVIPELHILQGFVNHLFWDGLVSLLGEEKALLWPKKVKVVPKNYHGRIFEGNACRKLLKASQLLNDIKIYKDVGFFKIVPYIAAFEAMDKVVDGCFASRKVNPNMNNLIFSLQKAIDNLQFLDHVSESLKIHVLKKHLEQCLSFIEDDAGLGYWSEQAGESVHRQFLKVWQRYKMNNIADEQYPTQLLKAVVEFSSLNL